jgi:hypothetical protein
LTDVIKGLFQGKLEDVKAVKFGQEMEAALWAGFKDVIGGKEVVGTRYK